MKLVTFEIATPLGPARRLGALLEGDQAGPVVDLTAAYAAHLALETDEPTPQGLAALRTPPDMIGWLTGAHASRAAAEAALGFVRRNPGTQLGPDGARLVYQAGEIRLLAPIPRPNTLRDFSIYQEHMTKADVPFVKTEAWYKTPPFYKGNPDSVVGPGAPIPFPYYTERLDLELEIGIVIGRTGRNLTFEQAKERIAGYTIFIDPSCRDGYAREPFGPTKRKDFCNVLGPCLVTPDEIDEGNLACRVIGDGETWWEGNSGRLRSATPEMLVAYCSDNETLHPGDVIGTGTIGHGCSMDLHRWPKVGTVMSFEIEGIGTLTHEIVAGERVVEHVLGLPGLLKYPGHDTAEMPKEAG